MTTKKFKERLKGRRNYLHITQLRLAEITGINLNTIKGYEKQNGPESPSLGNLEQLCIALKCNAAYLLGEIDTPTIEAESIQNAIGLSVEASERFHKLITFRHDFEVLFGETEECANEAQNESNSIVKLLDFLLSDSVNQMHENAGVELVDLLSDYLSTVYEKERYDIDGVSISAKELHEAKLLVINQTISKVYHLIPKDKKRRRASV